MYGNVYPFIQKNDFTLEIASTKVTPQPTLIAPDKKASHKPIRITNLSPKTLTDLGIGKFFEEGGKALNQEGLGTDISFNIVKLDNKDNSPVGIYFSLSIPVRVKGSADATITSKLHILNVFISDEHKDKGVDKKTLIEICSKQRTATYSNQVLKVNGTNYDVAFSQAPSSAVEWKMYTSNKYSDDGTMILDNNTNSIDLSFLITKINNNSTIEDSFFYLDKIEVTIKVTPKNSSGQSITKSITINLKRPILFTSIKNYELVFQREAGDVIKKAPMLTKPSFNLVAVPATTEAYHPEYILNSNYLYALLGYNSFMTLGRENIFLAESDENNSYKIRFFKHKNYFPLEHEVDGTYYYFDEDSKKISSTTASEKLSFSLENGIIVSQCEPDAQNENFIAVLKSNEANINGSVYIAKPHINSKFPILSSKSIYSTKYSYKLSERGNPFAPTQAAQFLAGLCNGSALDEINVALLEISLYLPFAYITRNPLLVLSLLFMHAIFILYRLYLADTVNQSIQEEGAIEVLNAKRDNTLLLSIFAKDLDPHSVDALALIHKDAFLKSRMHSINNFDFAILFFPFRTTTVNVATLEHPHMPTLEIENPSELFDKDKPILLTDDLKGFLISALQRMFGANIFTNPFPLTLISIQIPKSISKLPVAGISKNSKLFHPFIDIESNKILGRIDTKYITERDKLLNEMDKIRSEIEKSKNEYLKYAFNALYTFINNSTRSGVVFSGKSYYGIHHADDLPAKLYRINSGNWDAGAILIDKTTKDSQTTFTRSFFEVKPVIPTEDVINKTTHLEKISLDVTLIDDKYYKETLTDKEYLNSTLNISSIL